jgi:hypothetical protein
LAEVSNVQNFAISDVPKHPSFIPNSSGSQRYRFDSASDGSNLNFITDAVLVLNN